MFEFNICSKDQGSLMHHFGKKDAKGQGLLWKRSTAYLCQSHKSWGVSFNSELSEVSNITSDMRGVSKVGKQPFLNWWPVWPPWPDLWPIRTIFDLFVYPVGDHSGGSAASVYQRHHPGLSWEGDNEGLRFKNRCNLAGKAAAVSPPQAAVWR